MKQKMSEAEAISLVQKLALTLEAKVKLGSKKAKRIKKHKKFRKLELLLILLEEMMPVEVLVNFYLPTSINIEDFLGTYSSEGKYTPKNIKDIITYNQEGLIQHYLRSQTLPDDLFENPKHDVQNINDVLLQKAKLINKANKLLKKIKEDCNCTELDIIELIK